CHTYLGPCQMAPRAKMGARPEGQNIAGNPLDPDLPRVFIETFVAGRDHGGNCHHLASLELHAMEIHVVADEPAYSYNGKAPDKFINRAGDQRKVRCELAS